DAVDRATAAVGPAVAAGDPAAARVRVVEAAGHDRVEDPRALDVVDEDARALRDWIDGGREGERQRELAAHAQLLVARRRREAGDGQAALGGDDAVGARVAGIAQ